MSLYGTRTRYPIISLPHVDRFGTDHLTVEAHEIKIVLLALWVGRLCPPRSLVFSRMLKLHIVVLLWSTKQMNNTACSDLSVLESDDPLRVCVVL